MKRCPIIRIPLLLLLVLSLALAGFAGAQTPTVSITANDAAASEAGANPGRFRISRTGSTASALTVQMRLRGSATQGADYTFNIGVVGNTITIPAGSGFRDLVVQPIDDTLFDEGDEDIRLEVRSPLAAEYVIGAEFAAEVEIADNDVTPDPPVLTAEAAFSGFESGPLPATFRILREGTANVALNVLYSISGTASAGEDYVVQSGSIAMPAGVMSVNVSVPVIDDNLVEGAETLTFTILTSGITTQPPPPEAYELDLQNSASVTIVSDDLASSLNVFAVDDNATETGATPAIFRVQRTGGTAAALNVRYSLAGTATAGSDYTAMSGTVVMPAGAYFVDVPVHAIDDTEIESAETIIFNLLPTDAGAQTMQAYSLSVNTTATATLVNNDYPPPPIVVITTPDNRVAEQGKPFAITFDGSDGDGHIVSYTVVAGGTSQTYSTGYTTPPAAGTLYSGSVNVTFPARYTQNVTITIRDNAGNTATATRGVYVIAQQPPPRPPLPPRPVINIYALDAEAAESSGAPNTAKFRVTHDFPTTSPVYFMAAIGGTARAEDYTLNVTPYPSFLGPWFQIPAGQSEIIVEVTPVDDALIENPESVTLSLYTPPFNGFTEGGPNYFEPGTFGFYYGTSYAAGVIIQDNEVVPPHFSWVTIAATDAVATETTDNSDPAIFTLTRVGGDTALPLTVRYQLTTPPFTYPITFPRTVMATNGVDFQMLTGTATFPAGASTTQIVVSPIFELNVEPQETVQVTLLPSLLPHQTVGSYGIENSITANALLFSYTGNPALSVVSIETTWRRVGRRRFIRDSSGIRDVRPRQGTMQIIRSGPIANLTQPLTVYYSATGSAVNGVDYEFLTGVVTIPAGARAVTMAVVSRSVLNPQPLPVGLSITIIPPPSGPPTYLISSKNRGALSIRAETFVPAPTLGLDPAGLFSGAAPLLGAPLAAASLVDPPLAAPQPQAAAVERLSDGGTVVTLASPAGDKLFRVERSTDLITWETLEVVQSEEGEAEYYDPDSAGLDRCFYRMVEIPAI